MGGRILSEKREITSNIIISKILRLKKNSKKRRGRKFKLVG